MKKLLIGLFCAALFSCQGFAESKGKRGTINDGMNTVDTNGALYDGRPLTDSTNNAIENKTRTDIQQRDTFTTQGQ